jgi:hypothetical protein
MSELADELKQVVGNYTNEFKIIPNGNYANLYIQDIPSPLMYDIIVLAKSLNYNFLIKSWFNIYELKIEFYKTL